MATFMIIKKQLTQTMIRHSAKTPPSSSEIAAKQNPLSRPVFFRQSLSQTKSKPASGTDCKQRLAYLIPRPVNDCKRIRPCLHTCLYMVKQPVPKQTRHDHCQYSTSEIHKSARRHINHNQVGKKYKRAPPRSLDATSIRTKTAEKMLVTMT